MSALILFVCFAVVPFLYRSSYECPVSREECEKTVQFSTVECKQAGGALAQYPFTQACLYRNIYFVRGEPYLFFNKTPLPPRPSLETMKNRDDFDVRFRPTPVLTPSIRSLCQKHCILHHDYVSVLSDLWLGNIGHALFDSMYAIFTGLMEFGRHAAPFKIINAHARQDAPWVRGVIDTASPLGMVDGADFFFSPSAFDAHHLSELLVPNFARCMACVTGEVYEMDMGYDAMRPFRDHMLARFRPPPATRDGVRAIAISNKRFSDADRTALLQAMDAARPEIQGRWVDWRDLDFRSQLEVLSNTQIHLSAPGTGMIMQPFLPDGAVHINLGSCSLFSYQTSVTALFYRAWYPSWSDPLPGYMEQTIVASTPYHRALYYPLDEICGGLKAGRLGALLQEALGLVQAGFPIPVPKGLNLAPTGLIVQGMLADPLFRSHIQDPVAHKMCATSDYHWPEIIIEEQGGWQTGACLLNRTLLRELRGR